MFVRILTIALCSLCYCGFCAILNYNDLVNATISACRTPNVFLSSSYTNSVVQYRGTCTNLIDQCTADLALVIAMTYQLEHDENLIGSQPYMTSCIDLVSNIVCRLEHEKGSWIRYAAAFKYVVLLNNDERSVSGLTISTNMVSSASDHPPDMSVTNFWDAIISLERCPGISITTAFRLNAALKLAEDGKWAEVAVYTNQLSATDIKLFEDELK